MGCSFPAGGLFEGGLFDDAPMDVEPPVEPSLPEPGGSIAQPAPDSDDDMDNFGGPPSMGGNRYVHFSNLKL